MLNRSSIIGYSYRFWSGCGRHVRPALRRMLLVKKLLIVDSSSGVIKYVI